MRQKKSIVMQVKLVLLSFIFVIFGIILSGIYTMYVPMVYNFGEPPPVIDYDKIYTEEDTIRNNIEFDRIQAENRKKINSMRAGEKLYKIKETALLISWIPWLFVAFFINTKEKKYFICLLSGPIIFALIGLGTYVEIFTCFLAMMISQFVQNLAKSKRLKR